MIKCFERSTVERIEENSNDLSRCLFIRFSHNTKMYGHRKMRNKKLINRKKRQYTRMAVLLSSTSPWKWKGKKKRKKCYYNTGYSYLVTHPSTISAEQDLTCSADETRCSPCGILTPRWTHFFFLISKMRKGIKKRKNIWSPLQTHCCARNIFDLSTAWSRHVGRGESWEWVLSRLSDNNRASAQSFDLCFHEIGLCFEKLICVLVNWFVFWEIVLCFGKPICVLGNWFVFQKLFCVLVNWFVFWKIDLCFGKLICDWPFWATVQGWYYSRRAKFIGQYFN